MQKLQNSFLKRFVLPLILLFSACPIFSVEIDNTAWEQLRDVHAMYVTNVEKREWLPANENTYTFLRRKIKPFSLELMKKHDESKNKIIQLQEENKILSQKLQDASDTICILRMILLISVLLIMLTLILGLLRRFRKTDESRSAGTYISDNSNKCPRCGFSRNGDSPFCPQCKTRF